MKKTKIKRNISILNILLDVSKNVLLFVVTIATQGASLATIL